MSTKIIYVRPSSTCTVLLDEATGQRLYKIETSRRFVGSFTKVFRYENVASSSSKPPSHSHSGANKPRDGRSSGEARSMSGGSEEGSEGSGERKVVDAGGEASDDDLPAPVVENEIARLYWKWFSSTRIVFEGKIRRRAQYMPSVDSLKLSFVFNHENVSYRWSLARNKRLAKLVTNDPSRTPIASFHPGSLFKKVKPYMEVAPAGMDMLDHIIVTYLPVEARRQEM